MEYFHRLVLLCANRDKNGFYWSDADDKHFSCCEGLRYKGDESPLRIRVHLRLDGLSIGSNWLGQWNISSPGGYSCKISLSPGGSGCTLSWWWGLMSFQNWPSFIAWIGRKKREAGVSNGGADPRYSNAVSAIFCKYWRTWGSALPFSPPSFHMWVTGLTTLFDWDFLLLKTWFRHHPTMGWQYIVSEVGEGIHGPQGFKRH